MKPQPRPTVVTPLAGQTLSPSVTWSDDRAAKDSFFNPVGLSASLGAAPSAVGLVDWLIVSIAGPLAAAAASAAGWLTAGCSASAGVGAGFTAGGITAISLGAALVSSDLGTTSDCGA